MTFSKEKHDLYRGANSYDKAIKAIEYLCETRLRKSQKVAMQAILSMENYHEFEDMVKLAERLEVDFTLIHIAW